MPRIRSLVTRVEVDVAQRAHNCKGNVRHRIERGQRRLKVRSGRSWNHYCLECARTIALRDVRKLRDLSQELNKEPAPLSP